MPVTLFCPNLKCRSILQVPGSTRGKKVRCGQCGTTFLVPDEDTTSNAGTTAAPAEDTPAKDAS